MREELEAAITVALSEEALNELIGAVIDLGVPATAAVARLVSRRRHEIRAEVKRAARDVDVSGGSL